MILQLESFKKYFRVWAPDLPGHGALVDEPLTLDSAVKVLADLIKVCMCVCVCGE
jgi:pimeloyl-ACP methyl ester carboxylesterase